MGLRQRITEKLKETYRFIIVHNETYEQAGNYTFTLGRLLLLGIIATGGLILITSILIVFTPLREFIPGYTDEELKQAHGKLIEDTERLELQIARQDSFNLVLQQVLRLEQPDSMLNKAENLLDMSGDNLLGMNTSTLSFKNPVDGSLVGKFDEKGESYGITLRVTTNATVSAAADGRVILTEKTEGGYLIALQHQVNTVTVYKNNNRLLKKTGEYVLKGEPLAAAGFAAPTGGSPSLIFEIWEKNKPVDPLKYLTYNR